MERLLPTSVQTFETLRDKGMVYVDKTSYIDRLRKKSREIFLSRPRRFGKSLFTSTLEAYFLGKKELFTGLSISEIEEKKGDQAWRTYPVIPFYLASGEFNRENGLEDILDGVLESCIENYGLTGDYSINGETLPRRFKSLLERLYQKTKNHVVVLIDEYDNPLLKAENPEQERRNRELYKAFFSVLKDQDRYLEFVFFTGVTKYSKVSIFSDLNQLKDISLLDEFSGICGFTGKEIRDTFSPEIKEMAESRGISVDECLAQMKEKYDGYHFSGNSEGIYSPYSVINALSDKKLGRYWFGSASPRPIIKKLEESPIRPDELENGVTVRESDIMDYRIDDPDPIPLFYQSGYLSIKKYLPRFESYVLGFPNEEVKYGFLNSLLPFVLGEADREKSFSAQKIVMSLENGDTDALYTQLHSLFASAPYMTTRAASYEEVWRNQIFLIFELIGEFVVCEQHTSEGRSDIVIETNDYVYIMEFKVNGSAEEALKQIEEKGYAQRYKASRAQIIEIGASFSSRQRNIEEWRAKR
ncbi:AAA family ATPase [Candidatus Weimeria sp. HCP3S3_B5]|uniref:ATP-binding protein n=1 Tax=Candidatus Weimeria sp. HCP3S3_B5 TaxID=3438871 RepID=UPI003F8BB8CB